MDVTRLSVTDSDLSPLYSVSKKLDYKKVGMTHSQIF